MLSTKISFFCGLTLFIFLWYFEESSNMDVNREENQFVSSSSCSVQTEVLFSYESSQEQRKEKQKMCR